MRKLVIFAMLILACRLQAANYYFYVGGTGDFSNASDTNGGGAVSTIAMADAMGADGGPLAADTGATGTDATPSVITLAGTVLSTAGIADSELSGIFVYLSGTNCTSGCYRIQDNDSTADTITLYRNASSGGAMSALIVNVGGAFLLIGDDACVNGALAEIPHTLDIWDEHITDCNYTDSGNYPVEKDAGSPFANVATGDVVRIYDSGNIERRARVANKVDDNTLRFDIDLGDANDGNIEVFTNCNSSITVWCNRDFDGVGGNPYLLKDIKVGTGDTVRQYGSTVYNQWIRIKGFRTTPGDMDRGGAYYGDRIELNLNQGSARWGGFQVSDSAQNINIENFLITNMDKTTLKSGTKYRIGIQPVAGDAPKGGLIRNCYFKDLQWGVSALYNVAGSSNIWSPLAVVDCTAEDCVYDAATDEGGGFYGWGTLFQNCVADNCHDGFMIRDGTVCIYSVAYDAAEAGFEAISNNNTTFACVAYNCRDGFRPYFDNDTQLNMINCISYANTDNLRIGTMQATVGQQQGSWGFCANNIIYGAVASDYLDVFDTSATWDIAAGTFENDLNRDPAFIDLANNDFRRFGRLNQGIRTHGEGRTTIGAWQPNAIARPFGHRRATEGRYD